MALAFSHSLYPLKVKEKSLSCVRLFTTLWIAAHQAHLSMGFSRQEYWSRLPFPSPGNLPDPGIEPRSPALEADALSSKPVIAYFINFKKTALIFKSHQIRSDQSLSLVQFSATPWIVARQTPLSTGFPGQDT